MSTQLILTAPVEKLGNEGDAVTVADGYARNYLLPKGLAIVASPANLRRIEALRKKREAHLAAELAESQSVADKLVKQAFTITAKASAEGKLFGAVTAGDIADALKVEGIDIDRRKIVLEHPIRELGTFDVEVKLHAQVATKVKVWVVAASGEAGAAAPKEAGAKPAEPKPKKTARKQQS